ncbi:MAG: alpha/beta hydrolase [Vicinamibacterales bacterium]
MPTIEHAGARLRYERAGAGPPVLLVQGVGLIGHGWQPQVDGLQDRFTVITFDNRGIGGSTAGPGPLSIDTMARDALAIMDAEGFTRFHLGGHSMGGVIAQQIALLAPERVLSLALLCTFPRGADATRLTWAVLSAGIRTRLGTRRMRRRAFVDLVMPPITRGTEDLDALAERLAPLFGRDLADQPPIVMAQLRAMGQFDAFARLGALAPIPTLVLSARYDVISRVALGPVLAAAIPGARFLEIADAGHGVTIQRAAAVNAALAQHMARATS